MVGVAHALRRGLQPLADGQRAIVVAAALLLAAQHAGGNVAGLGNLVAGEVVLLLDGELEDDAGVAVVRRCVGQEVAGRAQAEGAVGHVAVAVLALDPGRRLNHVGIVADDHVHTQICQGLRDLRLALGGLAAEHLAPAAVDHDHVRTGAAQGVHVGLRIGLLRNQVDAVLQSVGIGLLLHAVERLGVAQEAHADVVDGDDLGGVVLHQRGGRAHVFHAQIAALGHRGLKIVKVAVQRVIVGQVQHVHAAVLQRCDQRRRGAHQRAAVGILGVAQRALDVGHGVVRVADHTGDVGEHGAEIVAAVRSLRGIQQVVLNGDLTQGADRRRAGRGLRRRSGGGRRRGGGRRGGRRRGRGPGEQRDAVLAAEGLHDHQHHNRYYNQKQYCQHAQTQGRDSVVSDAQAFFGFCHVIPLQEVFHTGRSARVLPRSGQAFVSCTVL